VRYIKTAEAQGDTDDMQNEVMSSLRYEFLAQCEKVCPNKQVLYDILVDVTGRKSTTKKFMWDICGETIVENLLAKHNNMIEYPHICENGDISYAGYNFATKQKEVFIY
jgi:hypothetical protein